MQCEKFEARLNELLDERQRPEMDAALAAHAERCEACRELLALQEQLWAGLEMWEPPAPRRDFSERVIALVCSEMAVGRGEVRVAELVHAEPITERNRAPQSVRWGYLAAGVAAVLAVCLFAASPWLRSPDGRSQQANRDNPNEKMQVLDLAQQQAPDVKSQIDPTLPMIPPEIAAQFAEAPELLDGRQTGQMIRTLTSRLPEVPEEPVERIPGLRPIASSFGTTIGMVRRTLPVVREQSPPPAPKPTAPGKPQADCGPLGAEHLV